MHVSCGTCVKNRQPATRKSMPPHSVRPLRKPQPTSAVANPRPLPLPSPDLLRPPWRRRLRSKRREFLVGLLLVPFMLMNGARNKQDQLGRVPTGCAYRLCLSAVPVFRN